MAEQRSPKPQVGGSIPSWPAIDLARWAEPTSRKRNLVVMADKIEGEEETRDWARWATVAAIVAGAVYANSYFAAESLLIRVLGLIVAAGASGWLASQTVKGKAFVTLCLDARIEIRKVVWPTRQETTQTTVVVLIVIFIVALILWLLDWGLNGVVSSVIG